MSGKSGGISKTVGVSAPGMFLQCLPQSESVLNSSNLLLIYSNQVQYPAFGVTFKSHGIVFHDAKNNSVYGTGTLPVEGRSALVAEGEIPDAPLFAAGEVYFPESYCSITVFVQECLSYEYRCSISRFHYDSARSYRFRLR